MATGRTPLDAQIGAQAEEDVVAKIHPVAGKADPALERVEQDGGSSKLPANLSPFTLKGA